MKIFFFILFLSFTVSTYGQYSVGTAYINHKDLNNSRYRPASLDLGNKSFQISADYYLWMGNNNFNYANVKKAHDESNIDFLSAEAKKKNMLGVGQDYQILGVAYQFSPDSGRNYVFGLSVVDRFAMNFEYTDNFLKLALRGNKQYAGQKVKLGPVTENVTYSREYVFSTSLPIFGTIDKGLRLGIRAKLIQGLGSIYMPKGHTSITTEQNGRYIEMDFDYAIHTSGISDFSFIRTKGWGAGLDLGLNYKFSKNLEISGNLLDLGRIKFTKNTKSYTKTGIGRYEGLVIDNLFGGSRVNLDSANAIIDADRRDGDAFRVPLGTKVVLEVVYKTNEKVRKNGYVASSSIFLTYVQGLNNAPGSVTRPFISAGYKHDFTRIFDAGLMVGVGGYNNIAVGTFFGFNFNETLKMSLISDNITALVAPRKGTGVDIAANFALSF